MASSLKILCILLALIFCLQKSDCNQTCEKTIKQVNKSSLSHVTLYTTKRCCEDGDDDDDDHDHAPFYIIHGRP